jgi:hypothetical protein
VVAAVATPPALNNGRDARIAIMLRLLLRRLLLGACALPLAAADTLTLTDSVARLEWSRTAAGWKLSTANVRTAAGERPAGIPGGDYTILFSQTPPDRTSPRFSLPGSREAFPEPAYHYVTPRWAEATTPVALNTAGEAQVFFPAEASVSASGAVTFRHETAAAILTATWSPDPSFPGDIDVALTLTARRSGFFSVATPTLAHVPLEELEWSVVPGYFMGRALNPNLPLALAYGHGLPDRPVLARERGTSTLASIATHRNGITSAVVASPGTAQDPWPGRGTSATRAPWRLGLSHMNRAAQLAPTLYHPVLGEPGSQLAAGESLQFRFRYVLRAGNWFDALKHVAHNIYRLPDFLALKHPARSLTDRLLALHGYVTDDATSLWRTEEFGGLTIGAQAYLGGVVGSDKDAMKNSDYGAMWMLARLTRDPRLVRDRLPFARNFKLAQQQREPGFFHGAALGQYYLSKSRRFTEEWGDYIEPVALTYYTLLDLGNILLFTPDDAELRDRLRLGADRLLAWQRADGDWPVAFDRGTTEPRFPELPDYRPTFYGLLVAHRLLGDEKYLSAARRGADWLLRHAVAHGRFVGVCGDMRFAPDFATAQIAQALLDLHAVTGEDRYRDGAIATARFYTTAIFTHPLATGAEKHAGGATRFEWEIAQLGLGFEHGGAVGSATIHGPILLASHAGLFLRIAGLTGDAFFRDLARAATLARDAFVDPQTSVASYYWGAMNRGAGPYPHHAWWQIGWIVDYLLAEAEFRSAGQIAFPKGFFTPKVGPHLSYGFAPGRVLGAAARLGWGAVPTDQSHVDALVAWAEEGERVFIILLNQRTDATVARIAPDAPTLTGRRDARWGGATVTTASGQIASVAAPGGYTVQLGGYGWAVLALDVTR